MATLSPLQKVNSPLAGRARSLPSDRPHWSSLDGNEKREKDDVNEEIADCWMWQGDWKVDLARAVDNDGWEYAVGYNREWFPSKKRSHFVKRRRWVRTRIRDPEYVMTLCCLQRRRACDGGGGGSCVVVGTMAAGVLVVGVYAVVAVVVAFLVVFVVTLVLVW